MAETGNSPSSKPLLHDQIDEIRYHLTEQMGEINSIINSINLICPFPADTFKKQDGEKSRSERTSLLTELDGIIDIIKKNNEYLYKSVSHLQKTI